MLSDIILLCLAEIRKYVSNKKNGTYKRMEIGIVDTVSFEQMIMECPTEVWTGIFQELQGNAGQRIPQHGDGCHGIVDVYQMGQSITSGGNISGSREAAGNVSERFCGRKRK